MHICCEVIWLLLKYCIHCTSAPSLHRVYWLSDYVHGSPNTHTYECVCGLSFLIYIHIDTLECLHLANLKIRWGTGTNKLGNVYFTLPTYFSPSFPSCLSIYHNHRSGKETSAQVKLQVDQTSKQYAHAWLARSLHVLWGRLMNTT